MAEYQLERLLRPKVELTSSLNSFAVAVFCLLCQPYLLMPPIMSVTCALLFLMYGFWRFSQYWKLNNYQKHLTVLPRFSMSLRKVPRSKSLMYFGKGFTWTARHTQRLRDCMLQGNAQYLEDSKFYKRAQRFSIWAERHHINWLHRLINWDSALNPVRPKPPVGGRGEIHGVGMYEGEQNIFKSRGERVGHTLVLGTTRVGKTRLAELLITQDIRIGNTVIVIDPKGDADLLKTMYSAASIAGRLDNFYCFHLAYPEYSARYNPLGSYNRITEVATRIANALPGQGNSAAFKEFGWRFANIIARALHFLGDRPSYETIRRYIENTDDLIIRYGEAWLEQQAPGQWQDKVATQKYGLTGHKDDKNKPNVPAKTPAERSRDIDAVCMARALVEYMNETKIQDPVAQGLLSAFKYEKTYFDKIVSSLGPFLEKLTSGKVSELLSPDYDDTDDDRPMFDCMSLIRTNGILYVGLAALQDVTVASAVGNALFADLTSTAGQLYAHGSGVHDSIKDPGVEKISLYADEFNELIGDEFIPLLNKAGGAGVQVTALTQTWSDVEARLGSAAKAEQVGGNLNTVVAMRVLKTETAAMLTDRLPKVEVARTTIISGATQSSNPDSDQDFTSNVQDRITTTDVPMLEASDLTRLPKGQAFILTEGGDLTKVRLPLSEQDKSDNIPDSIEKLTANMRLDLRKDYQDNWQKDIWWTANVAKSVDSNDVRNMVSASPGIGREEEAMLEVDHEALEDDE